MQLSSGKSNASKEFTMFNTQEFTDYHLIPAPNTEQESASLVVLLHGYGSSKDDLVQLVPIMKKKLTSTTFLVPNAPDTCASYSGGYEWFPIETDYLTGKMTLDFGRCKDNLKKLCNLIVKIANERSVREEKIGIFGFSQGGFMALALSLLTAHSWGATVSHSGIFYDYNDFKVTSLAKLHTEKQIPLLLIHGQQDDVLTFNEATETVAYLKSHNIEASTFFPANLSHSVSDETLQKTVDFFAKKLC